MSGFSLYQYSSSKQTNFTLRSSSFNTGSCFIKQFHPAYEARVLGKHFKTFTSGLARKSYPPVNLEVKGNLNDAVALVMVRFQVSRLNQYVITNARS